MVPLPVFLVFIPVALMLLDYWLEAGKEARKIEEICRYNPKECEIIRKAYELRLQHLTRDP